MTSGPHKKVNIILILLASSLYVLTLVFNGLSGSGVGVPSLFLYTVGQISDMFELFITPAGFAFTIWTVIYAWLSLSLLFFIISIFINTDSGRFVLMITLKNVVF